ncbi:hypothetical protein QQA45_06090 [Sneathia sanguinegens]|uniref:DUF7768 domain-containing protein n=1 Tax=Sneathia sanguinegens TaxID=40543 RepID=A0ABT7HKK7_9FUSO|nr:DUF4406 domain-containing protein [Sneathia sanguinegens]MDK9581063.1 hypothetical protein [Sneathia sanguinegens]
MKKTKYYPLVYICSLFSGDVKNNVIKAQKYSRYALDEGNIPIAPHLLFPQFMSDKSERKLAMHFNYVLLGKYEEVGVFGDYISSGMTEEIKISEKRNMKIRYIKEIA